MVCVLSWLNHVQLFATPWIVAYQAPLSMVLQARMLEWVAISFSRRSSRHRDGTCVSFVSCIGRQVLYHYARGSPIVLVTLYTQGLLF